MAWKARQVRESRSTDYSGDIGQNISHGRKEYETVNGLVESAATASSSDHPAIFYGACDLLPDKADDDECTSQTGQT